VTEGEISLEELARRLDARLVGKGSDVLVKGVGTLEDAGPDHVCYFGNPRYARQLETTRALAVIAGGEVVTSAPNILVVKNPYLAFRNALALFQPDRRSGFPGVHPAAVVHPSAALGPGVSIGPLAVVDRDARIGAGTGIGASCVIGPGAEIGADCVIHPLVSILAQCVLGDRVIVHSGAVIGSDGFGFVPDPGGRHAKIPQNGNVVVGDDVEIGAGTTVDRAVTGSTVIGAGSKLDNLVQVAHNVRIGKGCFLAAQTGVAGSTVIEDMVTCAGQVGIGGHLRIGSGAVITAKSGVSKNVKPGETVSGIPAREHRQNMRIMAAAARLPGLLRKLAGRH
jgi:UDP-3-O-[3-hydroxymyristoyl] glucosamine N-acyltransferase